jgi:DNA-binding MarR family transcriptional regulator
MTAEQRAMPGTTGEPPRAEPTIPFLLYGAGQLIEQELENRLATVGLTLRTMGVLAHLAHSPQLSYSDLARRGRVTVQSMHTTVRQLIANGDVEADSSSTHGQAAQLSVTPAGRERLQAARDRLADYEKEWLAEMDGDAEQLRTIARSAAAASWKLTIRPPI